MTTKNNLDKSFGPAGSFAGLILFAAGIVITIFSFAGLILVLIGSFVGFTTTSTQTDFEKKRMRFVNQLFGLIPSGNWINIEPDMKIGIKNSKKAWRIYSRSNRTLDLQNNDYRLILYNSVGKEIMPIQKTISLVDAKLNVDKISQLLGIGVI
ncbi:MAG: hypothetical protein IPM71_07905 [Bacteroidota bacterium]|nr:MAG: hypothetical protein IPM71_07905 [Bacteroidota bacterium]